MKRKEEEFHLKDDSSLNILTTYQYHHSTSSSDVDNISTINIQPTTSTHSLASSDSFSPINLYTIIPYLTYQQPVSPNYDSTRVLIGPLLYIATVHLVSPLVVFHYRLCDQYFFSQGVWALIENYRTVWRKFLLFTTNSVLWKSEGLQLFVLRQNFEHIHEYRTSW